MQALHEVVSRRLRCLLLGSLLLPSPRGLLPLCGWRPSVPWARAQQPVGDIARHARDDSVPVRLLLPLLEPAPLSSELGRGDSLPAAAEPARPLPVLGALVRRVTAGQAPPSALAVEALLRRPGVPGAVRQLVKHRRPTLRTPQPPRRRRHTHPALPQLPRPLPVPTALVRRVTAVEPTAAALAVESLLVRAGVGLAVGELVEDGLGCVVVVGLISVVRCGGTGTQQSTTT